MGSRQVIPTGPPYFIFYLTQMYSKQWRAGNNRRAVSELEAILCVHLCRPSRFHASHPLQGWRVSRALILEFETCSGGHCDDCSVAVHGVMYCTCTQRCSSRFAPRRRQFRGLMATLTVQSDGGRFYGRPRIPAGRPLAPRYLFSRAGQKRGANANMFLFTHIYLPSKSRCEDGRQLSLPTTVSAALSPPSPSFVISMPSRARELRRHSFFFERGLPSSFLPPSSVFISQADCSPAQAADTRERTVSE